MKLKVALDFGKLDPERVSTQLLPYEVLDSHGVLRAKGVVGSSYTASSVIEAEDSAPVFVRLTLPSGRTLLRKVTSGKKAELVTFSDSSFRGAPWYRWVSPRVSLASQKGVVATQKTISLGSSESVWVRIWQRSESGWRVAPLAFEDPESSKGARQFERQLGSSPFMLQFGGAKTPWRLMSLPGGGRVRVFFAAKSLVQGTEDSVRVVVTGFRPIAETLMQFLKSDPKAAAQLLTASQELPGISSIDSVDPVEALAASYVRLRVGAWSEEQTILLDGYCERFGWIPDFRLLRAITNARSGLSSHSKFDACVDDLFQSIRSGPPIFAEGARLIREMIEILSDIESVNDTDELKLARRLLRTSVDDGVAFSFYGADPYTPTVRRRFGIPEATRESDSRKHAKSGKRAASSVRSWKMSVEEARVESGIAGHEFTKASLPFPSREGSQPVSRSDGYLTFLRDFRRK